MKRQYTGIRSMFTTAYERWSRSGQNDPENFADFCDYNKEAQKLSAVDRKCMILFAVLGCGRSNEKTELLEFTLRTIPKESMVDSGEQSMDFESSGSVRPKRKRESSESLHDSLETFREVLSGHQEAQKASSRSELLAQMNAILKMRRSLTAEETDERDLLNSELEKVKAALRFGE